MLFGRDAECARIDAVLDAARAHRSGALVLRGEAGIGKTRLLEYAAGRGADFRVISALGVESEAELPFAGAHQLLLPVLAATRALPEFQARALMTALALQDGATPDRLTVCAATLSLLAAAADERPLLCIVDDAQWLDHASAEALTFAARRLQAEDVVMLFGAREPDAAVFDASGLTELRVEALAPPAAAALLAATTPALAATTAGRLVELTGGNPLALVEIPKALSRDQRLGREPLDDPLPVVREIEQAFLARVNRLPFEAQRALLLVAAGDPADTDGLREALRTATPDGALGHAERAGLLAPSRLEFCHPLARSAVYRGATSSERRAAHAALAGASGEPDRVAWHLAGAAEAADESVAAVLERAAETAGRRGGVAAEAKALERAARLTPDPDVRAARLLKAALAAESAGWLERAESMLEEVALATADPELRAQAVARRSYLLFGWGEFDRAYELAIAEAERSAAGSAVSPATSGALRILWRRLDIERALALADRSEQAVRGEDPNLELGTVVAWAWSLGGRTEDARQLARSSLDRTDPGSWLAIDFGTVLLYVEDYTAARATLEEVVTRSRAAGAPGVLSYALDQLAKLETRVGNLTRAYAVELESLQLTEPLGSGVALAACLLWTGLLESMLGRPDARPRAEQALAIAERLGDPWNAARARGVLGLDALVRGDLADAFDRLQAAVAVVADPRVHPNYLRLEGDYVETLVRLGRPAAAGRRLELLERQAESTASPWARATAARCSALLAAPDEADDAFAAALELHDAEPSVFERARTELCYGERLRRTGERRTSRERLRSALASFEAVGAQPWAERARVELRASGEHLRPRAPAAAERLTPQELQIALLVAEGLTNRDVAARLFLSPKTVEFHLTRIYRKLDVRSRAELVRRRLAGDPTELEPTHGA